MYGYVDVCMYVVCEKSCLLVVRVISDSKSLPRTCSSHLISARAGIYIYIYIYVRSCAGITGWSNLMSMAKFVVDYKYKQLPLYIYTLYVCVVISLPACSSLISNVSHPWNNITMQRQQDQRDSTYLHLVQHMESEHPSTIADGSDSHSTVREWSHR